MSERRLIIGKRYSLISKRCFPVLFNYKEAQNICLLLAGFKREQRDRTCQVAACADKLLTVGRKVE